MAGRESLRSIHILHHSISPFAAQIPEGDALHYNTGIPMLFARAIRAALPELEVEVWRPERTLPKAHTWQDGDGVVHRVFPSQYVRYKVEVSTGLLRAVKEASRKRDAYFWVHGIYNLHAYLLAPVLRDSPTIAQSHGGFPVRTMFSISRHRWLRYLYLPLHPMERMTLPQYSQLFALSTEEKRYMLRRLSIPENRISVSPTGIDFDRFSPGDRTLARGICRLDEDARYVLFVGRLSQEKGIRYLIDAFASVSARYSNARLLILGIGPLREQLEAQSDKLGLRDRVQFVGYVPATELPDWYRAADVTVLPSLIEWFGKVAAESMACGTAVVMTEGGGATDVIREFECGLLTPLGNSAELARAVCLTLAGSANTNPNIERGRQAFDWSVKLAGAFELFQAMAEDKHAT